MGNLWWKVKEVHLLCNAKIDQITIFVAGMVVLQNHNRPHAIKKWLDVFKIF